MGFTRLLESLTPLAALTQVFAGLGLVTILLAILKRNAERRCWQRFKTLTADWVDRLRETENRHPKDVSSSEWKSRCERLLTDANFSPIEIHQLLDTAVVVARGIATEKFFI